MHGHGCRRPLDRSGNAERTSQAQNALLALPPPRRERACGARQGSRNRDTRRSCVTENETIFKRPSTNSTSKPHRAGASERARQGAELAPAQLAVESTTDWSSLKNSIALSELQHQGIVSALQRHARVFRPALVAAALLLSC
jgi:hypothetical protein